jgi:predicted MFS family arabinose efflux permease
MPSAVWWASLTFAGILGFSRVSFGLLLPYLKHDFPASYTSYGIVASANFAGYLAGLLLMPLLPPSLHRRSVNTAAIALMFASLFASSFASNLTLLAGFRFANGVGQAVATMLTIGLTFSIVAPALRGRASGILWGGGGLGIAISGLALPAAAAYADGWRMIWLWMAALMAIVAVGLHRTLPPKDDAHETKKADRSNDRIAIAILAGEYFLFGAAFADYFTYAPAFAREIVASTFALALAWTLTGFAAAAGGGVWGRALDRSQRGETLAVCLAIGCAGALFLLFRNPLAAIASALLVGSSSFGTPAQTSALVRRYANAQSYVRALSVVTIAFAAGQTLGAPFGGFAADTRGLGASIALSALFFLVAAAVAFPIVGRKHEHVYELESNVGPHIEEPAS